MEGTRSQADAKKQARDLGGKPVPAQLAVEAPYARFSTSPYGLHPAVEVTLCLTASGRRITGLKGLIDTGSEITWIYPRDVRLDPATELEGDPRTGMYTVGVEVGGRVYHVLCGYADHRNAGTEQLLIGMNVLENWLMTLHGKRRVLSVTHLP